MANNVIRVGLIGAGGNTRSRHIPGFRKQEGIELVAVANRTPESAKKVADEFGIAKVAADWTELLADDGVDAVCIGTWPYMHEQLTIAALQAGKHVLCEARMAMNLAQARAMLKESRRHPALTAQIVPAPHTLAFDKTIIGMIGSGYIGKLITLDARVTVNSDFPKWESPVHWRHDKVLSGNNIMGMGIWYEAMMRWVGQASSVHAIGQSVVAYRTDKAGARVAMTIPDHVDIIGRMEQGGQMRFNFSTVVGLAPASAEVHIFGTEGTIALRQDKEGKMSLWSGKRGDSDLKEVAIDPAKRGGWRVEEEFVNAIRGREPVTHTDFATGVKYMEWTDAVTMSLRSGNSVQLPLMEG